MAQGVLLACTTLTTGDETGYITVLPPANCRKITFASSQCLSKARAGHVQRVSGPAAGVAPHAGPLSSRRFRAGAHTTIQDRRLGLPRDRRAQQKGPPPQWKRPSISLNRMPAD